MSDMDPRLVELVTSIMLDVGAAGATPPPSAPAAGQSRADWLADVARSRRENDGLADVLAIHLAVPRVDVGSVKDHSIPVDGGSIRARVYSPATPGPHAGVVFFHGGAWWLAGGEKGFGLTDDYCRFFSSRLPAVVVNVDYRLAPEAPYPHQLHDSLAGLEWAAAHADELSVDPDRISVMGASSGGNQAAAVCLLARERGGPAIAAQILHVPALDLTGGSPSVHEDPAWPALSEIIRLYATDEQRREPLASPLLAPSLADLPPAVIVTGTHDPLRDDGRRYAQRLAAAGGPVTHLEYPMLHNVALPETTEQMFVEMCEAIRAVAFR